MTGGAHRVVAPALGSTGIIEELPRRGTRPNQEGETKVKHILTACAVAIAALGIGLAQAEACTTTTFTYQGGGPLTAFLVDPVGTVSGEVDATGCDIAIYYDGGVNVVEFANIHGATQFGIVNNGANVGIFNNTIYDIGDVPLDGTQYGIGIYFAAGSAAIRQHHRQHDLELSKERYRNPRASRPRRGHPVQYHRRSGPRRFHRAERHRSRPRRDEHHGRR